MCTRGLDCGVPQDLHLNGPSSFEIRVARAARRTGDQLANVNKVLADITTAVAAVPGAVNNDPPKKLSRL